ncbi:uncharacterized protein [Littorina saxatilis]|uniref:uncharacterized protein isoform X2 n=1 Tax=Littorina saxatilis TaxID=31220 RepID=UPI0038B4AB8C
MQAWTTRLAALLLLQALVDTATSQFPVIDFTNSTCEICNRKCTKYNFQEYDIPTALCKRCVCSTDTLPYFKAFKDTHLEDVPFLNASLPFFPVTTRVQFFCMRWYARTTNRAIKARRNFLQRKLKSGLPVVSQQQWYVANLPNFVVSIVNVSFIVDVSTTRDDLECSGTDPHDCGVNCTSISLFAFDQSVPVITGPKSVYPGEKVTWHCKVDFSTIRDERDVEMIMEVVDAGDLHLEYKGPLFAGTKMHGLTGMQMDMSMTIKIPPRLVSSIFDIRCTCFNRIVMSPTTSGAYRVIVPNSAVVKPITESLTTAGVIFGCFGVLIISIFCTNYFLTKRRKMLETELKKGRMPAFPDAAKDRGILKTKKTGDAQRLWGDL